MKKFLKLFFTFSIIYCFIFSFFASQSFALQESDITVYSKCAIVYERNSKMVLYEKNIHEKVPMASTTKIMTCILILENCNIQDSVIVSDQAASVIGSRLGLHSGDKITVLDLLYGMMLCSGNDAAIALAEYCSESVENFSLLMNSKAEKLGLTSTHFVTPHGLDNENHFTTAYDFAILTDYALSNPLFKQIVGKKDHTVTINSSKKLIHNTNELLNDSIYGVKTGYTSKAGRCLISSATNGSLDVIVIVFGSDTKKIRTDDSKKLINYAFDNYENINIKNVLDKKYSDYMSLYLPYFKLEKTTKSLKTYIDSVDSKFYSVNKNFANFCFAEIEPFELTAPIYKDQIIGKINIFINNSQIDSVNIYSSVYIGRTSSLEYLKSFFFNFKNICNFP